MLREALHNSRNEVPLPVHVLSKIFDLGLLMYFFLIIYFHHSFLPVANLQISFAPRALFICSGSLMPNPPLLFDLLTVSHLTR